MNFDCCVGPGGATATLDAHTIKGGRLIVDTDTRYCAGRSGSVTAGGSGGIGTITVDPALGGEFLIDGTNVKIVPFYAGTGTPPVQSAALAITAATWTAAGTSGYVTCTTAAHSYVTGDFIAMSGMEPNAYNGIFQIIVTAATTFTYEMATDPGIATVTNSGCVKYWTVRQPILAANTITGGSWAAEVATVNFTSHNLAVNDWVLIAGVTPATYNGYYKVTASTATSISFPMSLTAGTWTSGGTATKTAQGYFLGLLQSFSLPCNPQGTVTATALATNNNVGWVKLKGLIHDFIGSATISIQGGTACSMTAAAPSSTGFIELCGNSTSIITIPRLGKNTFTGAWFNPQLHPKRSASITNVTTTATLTVVTTAVATLATGTAWAAGVLTCTTTAAHGFSVGTHITISGATPTLYNVTEAIVSVPSTTTFTINMAVTPGTWTSLGTCTPVHGIKVGSIITVTGATPAAYNGTFEVLTVPSATTLTYTMLSNPGGSATVQGNIVTQVCTSGTALVPSDNIQLPAATVNTYYAGVWVETAKGSNTYEFYPSTGSLSAVGAHNTTAAIGKVCSISTQGMLRIGHDGVRVNGYIPAAGLRIRVPNVTLSNTTRAAVPGVGPNIVNTATMTARTTWVSTGGNTGIMNINTINSSWYFNFVQTYSVTMANVGITEGMTLAEIASPYTLNQVGVGQSLALAVNALTQSLCFAGGTETDCTWTRASMTATTSYAVSRIDVFNLTVTNQMIRTMIFRAAVGAAEYLFRVNNCGYTNYKLIGGQCLLTTCKDMTFTTTSYCDTPTTTATGTTIPEYIFNTTANCQNIKMDGLTFFGETNRHPYSGLLYTAVGCNNIKMRNIGTAAAPLSMGSANAVGVLVASVAGAGCTNVELKRCYTTLTRTGITTAFDNSLSGVILENVWGTAANTFTVASLNMQAKGIIGTAVTTGQTAVYGSHFQDFFPTTTTGNIALAMNENTTDNPSASTVTKVQLALPSGFNSAGVIQMPLLNDEVVWESPDFFLGHTGFTVAAPTFISTAALTVTAGSWTTNYTTLTIGTHGLAAGDTIVVTGATPAAYNGVFVITNIVSLTQVRYYQLSTPGTWTSGGSILPLNNINTYYDLNTGSGFSTYKPLRDVRTGGATTSGNGILTMTSTAGLAAGDYVTSLVAGAGASAKINTVDSATQVTVNVNSSATTTDNVFYFNHLPSETVPAPTTGFKLRIKLKTWAAGATAAVTNIAIPTISTAAAQQYQYPLDTVTVELQNLIVGSRYRIEKVSDGSYLSDGTAATSTVNVTLSYIGLVRIRVRKSSGSPKYQPFETQANVTSSGASVYVSQVLDSIVI
jgi:hypothetical protein